jgi:GTP-binding protein EngB required for normal cell division|tara:strand:+ start:42 stop:341 length:300 start_codon:yes stop_codon:yes gene_type:complete
MKIVFILIFLFLSLASCQTVTKKIDEKVSEEEAQLSQWLNRSEEALKIEFGKPDKIDFKNNSRNRFYIYTKEKLKIKCERIFEISPENKVVGFTSKNCF